MRFTFAVLALAATLSAASANVWKRQSLPSCAENCIGSASTGGCSASDEQCLCSSSAFVDSVESCIEKSCDASDVQASLAAAEALCAQAGVTLSLTGSLPSATASGSGSASASGFASASASSGSHASSSSSSSSSSASHLEPTDVGSASPATTSTKSGASSVAVDGFLGLAAVGAAMFAAL
ncbi:hypothetical protein FOMPIDRAFT_1032413 [Fomitopsis schrenkii]|uniref:CFEM domain-containing protein n=1 Tax=Fomitopsis schrenkii TaxID=2126942 RepID=S8F3N5_FOMSC|nr:hypothetical protein FOMPIDRAFT_1032413 [Fomitopsis schrenkii]